MSTNRWIDKENMVYMCVCVCVNKYIYMMEYYLAIKNNEKTPFVDYHTK